MSWAQSYLFIPVENHSDIHTSVERFFIAFSFNVVPLMVVSIIVDMPLLILQEYTIGWSPVFSVCSLFVNGLLLILKPQSYTLSHSASVVEEKAGASDTTCPSLTAEVFYGSAPASVNTKNQFTFIENVCCRHFPEYRTKRSGCYVPVVHYTVHLHLDHNNLTFV